MCQSFFPLLQDTSAKNNRNKNQQTKSKRKTKIYPYQTVALAIINCNGIQQTNQMANNTHGKHAAMHGVKETPNKQKLFFLSSLARNQTKQDDTAQMVRIKNLSEYLDTITVLS